MPERTGADRPSRTGQFAQLEADGISTEITGNGDEALAHQIAT